MNKGTAIKKKKIQCFGSTVDRFQTFKTDIKTICPGPAAYDLINEPQMDLRPKLGASFPKQ